MTRTLGGVAAILLATAALVGAQGRTAEPARIDPSKATGKPEAYLGCVKLTLGWYNYRLQNAVKAGSSSSTPGQAFRIIVPKVNVQEVAKSCS